MQADEKSPKIKRRIKDSVFNDLFRDVRNLRRLYNDLFGDGENYRDEDFKIATLENILVDTVYNDLGFLVGDKLIILVEAQSTFNPNLPLRFLSYLANTYLNYILNKKLNIYGTKRLVLPKPKFYVVYTGRQELGTEEFRLSELYSLERDEEVLIELVVKIIGKKDNKGIPNIRNIKDVDNTRNTENTKNIKDTENAKNAKNIKDSQNIKDIKDVKNIKNTENTIIDEYIEFCQIFDELSNKEGYTKVEAIRETITSCIEKDILREYLRLRSKEVADMMMQMITDEQAMDIILEEKYKIGKDEGIALGEARGIALGRNEGISLGERRALLNIVSVMTENGLGIQEISKNTGLSEAEVENLLLSAQR